MEMWHIGPGASRRVRSSWRWCIAVLLCGGVGAPAGAGTATGTFTVQAVINSACNVSANTLNFGAYSPSSATALTGTSTISVYCTSGSPYTTALNIGSGGGSFTARTLLNGTYTLNFNLYRDSAYSQVWGDGTAGTSVIPSSPDTIVTKGGSASYTVYGRIAADAAISPGGYSDSIVVTAGY